MSIVLLGGPSLAPGQAITFDQACAIPTASVHVLASNTGHRFTLLVGPRGNIE